MISRTDWRSMRPCLISVFAALTLAACGGGGAPSHNAARIELDQSAQSVPDTQAVDRYIQSQMALQHIPGLTLAVLQDGKTVYAKAYGVGTLQGAVATRLEDRFQIGSMSKAFVATAIMMLVEEGKVGLDQPVATYLGPVPAHWTGMTVRQLLNHTAGLAQYPDPAVVATLDPNKRYNDDELLAIAKSFAMSGKVGGAWEYSNVGYDLLGILIGKVTGKPYGLMLQERIFTPLGMNDARMLAPQQSAVGSATGYVTVDGVPQVFVPGGAQLNYLGLGASGVEASVLDMAKWDAALRSERLLKKSSLDLMWTASAAVPPPYGDMGGNASYGFGWFLKDSNGVRKVFHSGSMPAFTSDFIRYPDAGWSVVILTNIDHGTADPQTMTRAVVRMFNPALP